MSANQLDDKGVIETCGSCGQKNRISFARLGQAARCGRCKAELAGADAPLEIEEETGFESLMAGSQLPILVDFWADWCGPCKMMAPELKRVAAHADGRYLVAKVNTEGLPLLAQRFRIGALPTLVLMAGGNEMRRLEGARPASEIQHFILQSLRAAA